MTKETGNVIIHLSTGYISIIFHIPSTLYKRYSCYIFPIPQKKVSIIYSFYFNSIRALFFAFSIYSLLILFHIPLAEFCLYDLAITPSKSRIHQLYLEYAALACHHLFYHITLNICSRSRSLHFFFLFKILSLFCFFSCNPLRLNGSLFICSFILI